MISGPETGLTDPLTPSPGGVVAFLTDYGHTDDYVGLLHASAARENPLVSRIDLCHDIEAGNIEQAAFFLLHDHVYLPRGSVIVAVVDPGVGTDRRVLVASYHRPAPGGVIHCVAPDNGLLDPFIHDRRSEGEDVQVHSASSEDVLEKLSVEARRPMPEPSTTFHGRDIFAPLGARIAAGARVEAYASPTDSWVQIEWRPPRRRSDATLGRVMYCDHFGNLVTDIPVGDREGDVVILSRSLPRVRTFADIAPGEVAWLRGSKGTVEIVMNGQSARDRLQAGRGETVVFAPSPE